MAGSDHIILEHLQAISAMLDDVRDTLNRLNHKVDGMAEAPQFASMDHTLTGLTFAVGVGFAAITHRLAELDTRLARLDRGKL